MIRTSRCAVPAEKQPQNAAEKHRRAYKVRCAGPVRTASGRAAGQAVRQAGGARRGGEWRGNESAGSPARRWRPDADSAREKSGAPGGARHRRCSVREEIAEPPLPASSPIRQTTSALSWPVVTTKRRPVEVGFKGSGNGILEAVAVMGRGENGRTVAFGAEGDRGENGCERAG